MTSRRSRGRRERAAAPSETGGSGRGVEAELLVRRLVVRSFAEFFEDGCPHLAASIAFRVLFALFPLAIVVAAVFGLTSGVVGFRPDVIDAIVTQVPLTDEGRERFRDLLEETAGLDAVGILGALGLVWAASGMMSAVRTALNLAWDAEDRRPWLIGKVVDVAFVFGAALAVALSVGLSLSVRLAQELVVWARLDGVVTEALVGSVAPFALTFVVAIVVYRLVPATGPRLRDLAAPAVLVAAVFTLAQVLFAAYLEAFGRYNALYGSFGVVVAFMLFTYLAALVFLFGAELGAATPRVREELRRGEIGDGSRPLALQAQSFLKSLVIRSGRDSPETTRGGG